MFMMMMMMMTGLLNSVPKITQLGRLTH